MKGADGTVGDGSAPLDTLAAELTSAAHAVALRQGVGASGSTCNWTFGGRWPRRSICGGGNGHGP